MRIYVNMLLMIDKVKKNPIVTSILAILLCLFAYMYMTDTLSYPYIMASRQIQMIKYCYFGSTKLSSSEYGFSVDVPEKYCLLPNRIFPDDGTVQIVPKGFYFVINEYATGSIINNSKSTLLFEPIASDRNTKSVLEALEKGGFLTEATISEKTNPNKLKITIVKNVKGIDETKHYDWAFVMHPNGKVFLSILLADSDTTVFDYILDSLKVN